MKQVMLFSCSREVAPSSRRSRIVQEWVEKGAERIFYILTNRRMAVRRSTKNAVVKYTAGAKANIPSRSSIKNLLFESRLAWHRAADLVRIDDRTDGTRKIISRHQGQGIYPSTDREFRAKYPLPGKGDARPAVL